MPKSLFIPPPSKAELKAGPAGPLRRIKPEALFSLDTLRRAWLKVRTVGGAAGIDGVTIERFERELEANLSALQADLLNRRYYPQRVRRLLAPKANGGLRPLALWALRDKIAQRVVYDCIEPYFESQFLNCSYGFRPGRGARQVVAAITRQRNNHCCWVADIDIKDCFDSLDSDLTLRFVRQQVRDPIILGLIKAWLRAQVFNEIGGPQAAGASQGAVISPLLANIYLHQVDLQLVKQHQLVRYADDMVIFCRRKSEAEAALQATAAALQRVRLQLNPHKSQVVHFDQGFKFVGYFFLRNEHFNLK
jgi:group II intron reverse transcriptase/maturase